jgi:hypothetical protein
MSTVDSTSHAARPHPGAAASEAQTVSYNSALAGPAPNQPALVPVDAGLLHELQALQEDLWDYVEAFMITNGLGVRLERVLRDYLKKDKSLVEEEFYWSGIEDGLRGKFLRDELSANALRLLGEDHQLVSDADDSLRRAREKIDLATDPFQAATRSELAREVLRCVESMRNSAAGVASRCETRAKDLSVEVKVCVDRIFRRMDMARDAGGYTERSAAEAKAPDSAVQATATDSRGGSAPVDPAAALPQSDLASHDVMGHLDPDSLRSRPT